MLAAQVAPELRMARYVAVRLIAIASQRQSVIKQAIQAADALIPPVNVFFAEVMLRHRDRPRAEVFGEFLEAQLRLRAVGRVQGGVMQADLEAPLLKTLGPGPILGLGARCRRDRRAYPRLESAKRPWWCGIPDRSAGRTFRVRLPMFGSPDRRRW